MAGMGTLAKKRKQAQSAREGRLRNRKVTGKVLLRVIQKDRRTYTAAPPFELPHCGAGILEMKVQHPIKGIIILSVSSVRFSEAYSEQVFLGVDLPF